MNQHMQKLACTCASWEEGFKASHEEVDTSMLLYDVRWPSGQLYYAQFVEVTKPEYDVKWTYNTDLTEVQTALMHAMVTRHQSHFAFGMQDLGCHSTH